MSEKKENLNVLGGPLQSCCGTHRTGYYRDGFCRTEEDDLGRHVVCAMMTKEFLEFSFSQGNDLMTPRPLNEFPGLKEGDQWCLCVLRWIEALEAGKAPPVDLLATHESTLEFVLLEDLKKHALLS